MDLERNELLVKELIEFKWCDQCKQGSPGAAAQVGCTMMCGPRLFGRLLPHMKEYGRVGQKIVDIKMKIEEINQSSLKFKDYQKMKKDMEFEKMKQVSSYKPQSRPTSTTLTMIEEQKEEEYGGDGGAA